MARPWIRSGPLCRDVADCADPAGGGQRPGWDGFHQPGAGDGFFGGPVPGCEGASDRHSTGYFTEGLDEEVRKAVLGAAEKLAELGAQVEEFDLSLVEYAIPAYYTIASAEASSNLERFDGIKYGYRAPEYEGLHDMYKRTRSEGFGTEVKRRIMLGSFVLSSGYYDAYYLKALRTKALIKKSLIRLLENMTCFLPRQLLIQRRRSEKA